jgi:predicted HTH domain antitoxin
MATKTTVEVETGISEASRSPEERVAREAAILARWQNAELTIREAAEQLGLSYNEFLELLAARQIPVERSPLALETIQATLRQLREASQ